MIFKKNNLYVFGASGHAKELVNLAKNTHKNCPTFHRFVFVSSKGQEAGTISEEKLSKVASDTFFCKAEKLRVVLGIGSPKVREKIDRLVLNPNSFLIPQNLISSSANVPEEMLHLVRGSCPKWNINPRNQRGIIICPGVTVTVDVKLGRHVHLNTGCTVCHDVEIGDYSIVSPMATVCGNVTIGKRCYIGAGAVIRDGVSIADDVTVGAGAVVVSDLKDPGTYVGCPAKFLKEESI